MRKDDVVVNLVNTILVKFGSYFLEENEVIYNASYALIFDFLNQSSCI